MALAVNDPVLTGDDDDDARIVRLASSPGGDAFDLLYRRYADKVWRLCRVRLGNDADADDACQETLLRAHRALPRFQPGAPMWPWLATIAANICIDMRRTRRCDSLDDGDLGTCHFEEHAGGTDPHTVVVGRLRHQLVDDALKALPSRYRSAIHLRDLEGWSYADIADLDGSTVAMVRGTLHRGRRALRERIHALATGRGMWPLPALVPGLLGLPAWLRRGAATRPAGVRTASEVGTALGPAGTTMAATAAVVVMAVVSAVGIPTISEGSAAGAGTVSADHGFPPAAALPLPWSSADRDADLGGMTDDEPAEPAPAPTGGSTPLPPVAPPPADASADVDDGGVVTASVTASVTDESGEEADDGRRGVEVPVWFNPGCDKTDVQRAACDQAAPLSSPRDG